MLVVVKDTGDALALEMLRVTEAAAISSAREMGTGDRKKADLVATETMRHVMDTVPMRGTIVIGEGERDEAPMLFIGEEVGRASRLELAQAVDIAVDPSLGRFVYTANFLGNSISGFQLDPNAGTLKLTHATPYPSGYQPTAVALIPHGNHSLQSVTP